MSKKVVIEPVKNLNELATFYGFELDDEQKKFRDDIYNKDKLIIFCNAKSGTGKTTISVGVADIMCKCGMYDKIVYIASPTQEQKQGYLKGSLEEKSAPYFEPLYDAMVELGIPESSVVSEDNMIGQKEGRAYIYCTTHTYLRGVNFKNSVVIIDEAQNFYKDELKKTLTRIHDNCKVIVIGHTGQVDLYSHPERSGFIMYMNHFKNTNDDRVSICNLTSNYRGWISTVADSLD